ncbi:MAG TPA: hypothetical protein VNA21_03245 [Steroidobacteraceae bacterium]|nr:hypothetical protein [Steroidobacteraceae bacterium]
MTASARQTQSAAPARIHLRIKHPDLDPEEITQTLSMSPEHTLEAGRSGSSALHADCYWIAPLHFAMLDEPGGGGASRQSISRDASIAQVSALQMMPHESIVGFALRQLQSHQSFFQRIHDEGGTATLLITTDNPGSMTIEPALARKLADMSLALELDWSGSVE